MCFIHNNLDILLAFGQDGAVVVSTLGFHIGKHLSLWILHVSSSYSFFILQRHIIKMQLNVIKI